METERNTSVSVFRPRVFINLFLQETAMIFQYETGEAPAAGDRLNTDGKRASGCYTVVFFLAHSDQFDIFN